MQGFLHPLDVLAADPDEVGPLADVVAEGVGGVVRAEDRGQEAVGVQPLDPLAVAAVGLRPALDLAGERRGRDGDVEPGPGEGQGQDVAVRARGLEGDGRDTVLSQPGDEVAESGRVGRELGRVGVRGGDPVGPVADVDAGRVAVGDRQGVEVGRRLGAGVAGVDMAVSGGRGSPRDGGVGVGAAVPTGSGRVDRDAVRSPDVRPKALPGPVEPAGGVVPPPKRNRAWPSAESQGMLATSSRRRAARPASRSGTRR